MRVCIKHITNFPEWQGEFFDTLESNEEYVSGEYLYSQTKMIATGDLVQVKAYTENGKEEFTGICSHYWKTYKKYTVSNKRSRTHYNRYRVIYRLTDRGLAHVKEHMLEFKI